MSRFLYKTGTLPSGIAQPPKKWISCHDTAAITLKSCLRTNAEHCTPTLLYGYCFSTCVQQLWHIYITSLSPFNKPLGYNLYFSITSNTSLGEAYVLSNATSFSVLTINYVLSDLTRTEFHVKVAFYVHGRILYRVLNNLLLSLQPYRSIFACC